MNYLDYETLLELYFYVIRDVMASGDSGILSEQSLKSALARPQNAAQYEKADGLRQAAFLFHGITTGHGFLDGNKRAAFLSLGWFLHNNSLGQIRAAKNEIVQFCLETAAGAMSVDDVEQWVRDHVK